MKSAVALLITLGTILIFEDCRDKKECHFTYYENGQIKKKYYMQDTLIEDTMTSYYENGKISSIELWSNDNKDGKALYFHKNGKLYAKGQYKDSLKTGLWYFYDSLGAFIAKEEYFITNSREKLNKFWYKDTAKASFYYTILPMINHINKDDTVYDFFINIQKHIMKNVRVVYGKSDGDFKDKFSYGEKFKVFPKADTITSNNNWFIISNVSSRDLPHLKGYVEGFEQYNDTTSVHKLSYFLFTRYFQQ